MRHNWRLPIILSFILLAGATSGCTLLEQILRGLGRACETDPLVVTKTDDSNDGLCTAEDCSLREAIITANGCEGSDVINLAAGTYEYSLRGASTYPAEFGLLEITDDLTIHGNGAMSSGQFRVEGSETTVSISNFSMGYFSNEGLLSLNDVAFGGFVNAGRVTGTDVAGRTVSNSGTFNLEGGDFSNHAVPERMLTRTSTYGVQFIHNDGGSMTLNDVVIANNESDDEYEGEFVPVTAVTNERGYLELNRVQIRDNNPPAAVPGRGVVVYGDPSARTILNQVTISGHHGLGIVAGTGGGSLEIIDSEITDNSGGAMFLDGGSSVTILRSTISGNGTEDRLTDDCGVIQNRADSLYIENSTISGNLDSGAGCGVIQNQTLVELVNTTIYDNALPAIFNLISGSPRADIQRSILAGSAGDNCVNPGAYSLGFNLFDDDSCSPDSAEGDIVEAGAPLGLLPLADNGGMTRTHALDPGSPALDGGGPRCLVTDQRGVSRPQGAACDIGAFESEATASDSEAGEATAVPTATAVSEAPPPTVISNALCWKGPGAAYEVVSAVDAGTEVMLLGQGLGVEHWVIDNPRYPGVACWIPMDRVQVAPSMDMSGLRLFDIPPLPTPTPPLGCKYQGPNDNEPVCYPINQCPVDFEDSEGACVP